MNEDDFLECPECGETFHSELDGREINYCPFCGADLRFSETMRNGLEEDSNSPLEMYQ